jgi:hypothetical protein
MNLVTVTCNRDYQHMLLQAESIQKFVEPCTHWIVINEYDDIDIEYWHTSLSQYYTNHVYKILTPKDFATSPTHMSGWHTQQYYKLAISTLINDDYLILDTKTFFFKQVSLDYWKDTMGSGILHKFGESIDGPPWEDISHHYAKKFNTSPITHFLFNTPFKVNIDIIKKYNIENLMYDLYPTKEEEQIYFELTNKQLYPSEFILYSYIARDYITQHISKERSFLYLIPAHVKNKTKTEVFIEVIRKLSVANTNKNINSFMLHPLIFDYLENNHIDYINKWLNKLGFIFQFEPKSLQ